MQKNPKSGKFWFAIVTYGIVLFVGLQHLDVVKKLFVWILALLQPIAFGLGIAFIINLLMDIFRDHIFKGLATSDTEWKNKLATALSALSTLLVAAASVTAVVFLIVPEVSEAINMLIEKMPTSSDAVFSYLNDKLQSIHAPQSLITQINEFNMDWEQFIQFISRILEGKVQTLLGTAFSATASVVSTFTNVILGLIIAVYILAQKKRFTEVLKKIIMLIVPEHLHEKTTDILNLTNISFKNFISGQILEAFIIGALCIIGLTIFRFPYALAIGMLTGITALLPIIGAWIGGGIGLLLVWVDSPDKAIWFILFIVVLQQLEGQFIYPKVIGDRLGLPGLLVLLAVILGGGIGGIVGIMFAVPIFAILYTLLKQEIERREKNTPPNEKKAVTESAKTEPVPTPVSVTAPPTPSAPKSTPKPSTKPKQQTSRKRKHR